MTAPARTRRDRCPGVFRPWPASDGALVRLRLPGGRTTAPALGALLGVASRYGDGDVHLTGRANLQLRGLPNDGVDGTDGTGGTGGTGGLRDDVAAAITATGMVPSPSHDLVRNLMLSPASGLPGADGADGGGRADLRGVLADLDRLICADPALAELPGRFLFVLDDGRGDLVARSGDLGLVALDAYAGQLRVGAGLGPVVALDEAAERLVDLARRFLTVRGTGPHAAWHVEELTGTLVPPVDADPRLPTPAPPLAYGEGPAGDHVAVPDGRIDQALGRRLVATGGTLVVTPWHGVLVTTT